MKQQRRDEVTKLLELIAQDNYSKKILFSLPVLEQRQKALGALLSDYGDYDPIYILMVAVVALRRSGEQKLADRVELLTKAERVEN